MTMQAQMDNLDVVAAGSSMQVNHPCLDVVAAGSGGQVVAFKPVYRGKYLPAWLHGKEEKQSMNDPSTEDKEFKAWEKDVLASHISHSISACNRQVKVRGHPYKSHRPIKNTSKKI
eukprot:g5648.t1